MSKIDYRKCFASEDHYGCAILSEKLCKTKGKCRFFKTKEQFEKDKEAYRFLNLLKKEETK